MKLRKLLPVVAVLFWLLSMMPQLSLADNGHPIAIRRWPGDGVTIETMWGLSVGAGLDKESEVAKGIDLLTESVSDRNVVFLRRRANEAEVSYDDVASKDTKEEDVGIVQGPPVEAVAGEKEKQAKESQAAWTAIYVDDVRVYLMHRMPPDEVLEDHKKKIEELKKRPAVALVVLGDEFEKVDEDVPHNTIAFSTGTPDRTRIVCLSTEPYKMSDRLGKLFDRKEAAQKPTRDLFASLSLEQMNFKPPNGTHTPRWNAEHMMGRELLFFSQIYHGADKSIPVMDLNPKQMPKDYKFAHPDWTGEEEARQLQRVEDFTRRFAYLLDGMDLDKKAKSSRFWSPRALLLQMERHYNEHTSNVRKKMKLEAWPKDPSEKE